MKSKPKRPKLEDCWCFTDMGFSCGFWLPSITQGCCLCCLIHLLHRVGGVSGQQLTKQTTVLQILANKALSAADANFISFPCAPLILRQVARHLRASSNHHHPPPNHHQTCTNHHQSNTKPVPTTNTNNFHMVPTTFNSVHLPNTTQECPTL